MRPVPIIRDAATPDFPAILRLNLESEAFLSPLSAERLMQLDRHAWHHRVALWDGEVAAFLLALGPGLDYDSPNYRWFAERYTDFVYVDRIVVSATARSGRLATSMYEDLLRRATQSRIARITCEFDTDPPNEASRRFHERFGFVQVGTQRVGANLKSVSLQELVLAA
jgi:predicted GNAT superfamily acetyltransferase